MPLRAAAQPNSFVYRYLPNNPARLEDGGKMQALQVSIDGQPVTFGGVGPAAAAADIISSDAKETAHAGDVVAHQVGDDPRVAHGGYASLHRHQAAKDGRRHALQASGKYDLVAGVPASAPFSLVATGDTDAPTSQEPELAARGAWGSLFRVDLNHEQFC